jgi:hypothetical protein
MVCLLEERRSWSEESFSVLSEKSTSSAGDSVKIKAS